MRLRIVVADDNGLILDEVNNAKHRIVASAANGLALLRTAAAVTPDLIVTDISMPQISGIEVARHLRESGSKTKIIALSAHREPEFISAAFEVGITGYVFKDSLYTDMPIAIADVLNNRTFVSTDKE